MQPRPRLVQVDTPEARKRKHGGLVTFCQMPGSRRGAEVLLEGTAVLELQNSSPNSPARRDPCTKTIT